MIRKLSWQHDRGFLTSQPNLVQQHVSTKWPGKHYLSGNNKKTYIEGSRLQMAIKKRNKKSTEYTPGV